MPLISTAAQCRALDAATIEDIGVPGIALMEIASRGVADIVREHHRPGADQGVVVVCGSGNNGGDGYGAARWLHLWGFPVRIVRVGGEPSGDAAIMRAAAIRLGIPELDALPAEGGILLDAVFGTGLAREVTGRHATILRGMAAHPAPVVAVDLPSGLHADTGARLGPVPRAIRTVTFGRLKPAFFTPGSDLAGEVHLIDIGVAARGEAIAEVSEVHGLRSRWPHRAAGSHKGTHGHLAVVAGSVEMAGAAILTCLGACRAGAGLITLFIVPEALSRLSRLPANVMVRPLPPADALRESAAFDAVAIGPGLGGGRPLEPTVVEALHAAIVRDQPIVLDADALIPGLPAGRRVLRTPHPGELGRLLDRSASAIQADRFGSVAELPGTVLLKGRHTLIHDGHGRIAVNPTGSPVLATAGSGDVLTGIIGALLARGATPFDAGRLAAWVHGRAGELLGLRGPDGHIAPDLAETVPLAIAELLDVPADR